MAVQEDLNAIFAAENGVSPALEDIADQAIEAAAGFDVLDASADAVEGALDAVERSAASAVVPLEAVETQTEAVGDAALASAAKVETLDAALDDLDGVALTDLPDKQATAVRTDINEASVAATTARLDTLARDRTVRIDTATEGYDGVGPLDGETIPIHTTLDEASATATATLLDTLTRDRTVEIAADVDDSSFALPGVAGGTVPFTAGGGVNAPDVSPDSQTVPFEAGGMELPDLSGLQFPATDGGKELTALGGAGHVAAEGLDAASSSAIEASAASALAASEADEAGDGFLSMVFGGEVASSALDGVRSSAVGAVPGLSAAANATDEYGDEASEAAAETAALQTSMAGLGGSGLGTEFLGFHGSLASVATILPVVIALLGGLVGPLGAVTAGAIGAGGALAGLFGAGLLSQAEGLVGTVQEIDGELKTVEGTGEAIQVIFGDIKDRAAEMLAPLQTAQTADFFQGAVEAGLTTFEDFVGLTTRLMNPLFAMGDRLGETFAIEEPRFFAELEATTRAMLPALEAVAVWLLGAIPDGLAWMREEGMQTAGAVVSLAGGVLDLAVELAEVGGVVWQTVGPALTFLLGIVASTVDVFSDLPGPVQEAAVVAVGAAAAFTALGGAAGIASAATGALGAVLAAVSWPVVAVGALAGAAYLLADHFGLVDDITNVLTGSVDTLASGVQWLLGLLPGVSSEVGVLAQVGQAAAGAWNFLVEVVEGAINTLLGMPDWAMWIPGLGQVIALAKGGMWVFENWGSIMQWVGSVAQQAASLAASAWGAFASFIGGITSRIVEGFEMMVNTAIDVVNQVADAASTLPGVNIKTGLESDFEVGDVSAGAKKATEGPVDLTGLKLNQSGAGGGSISGNSGQQPGGSGESSFGSGGYGGYGGRDGSDALPAGTTTAGGGQTTINNTVEYYEGNNESRSEVERQRIVRGIVRDMQSEQRRTQSGLG